ncbi:MAG: DNA helicase PcrA [Lachnospiraceae bacterium]|nr:DNA helicase PcrA [Lachnospiraceae bacterium]MDY5742398.1 DNA helicase PcrA [Lachnospiraceae bacterium]
MATYQHLNREQWEAVQTTEGPLLLLAGAGSGKTGVLTHRIAYLIEEKGINPWNIFAITFTNKAAGEMRERVDRLVGEGGDQIWVSTFHSACVRILRRYIDRIGYDSRFTIYDTDDQKTLMKEILKRMQVDTKQYPERYFLGRISDAKNKMLTAEDLLKTADQPVAKKVAMVYQEYEKELKKCEALDFDDLLLKTVELFSSVPEALDYYRNRFRYIMVDEYQDTNRVQFEMIRLLADKYRNLCVVGDDDQSIYKFRGADITNILDFELVYPDAKVIKLEQNYRSTGTILEAANAVIAHNKRRKKKHLWTDKGMGEKIAVREFGTGYDEAAFIVKDIAEQKKRGGYAYQDSAVLYRTNAQSRMLEEKFILAGVPYRIVGGVNFYARKEIKDILAYLKILHNPADDVAVRRIINVPKRGIGATTIAKVSDYAVTGNMTWWSAFRQREEIPDLGKAAVSKLDGFAAVIEALRETADAGDISRLIKRVIEDVEYDKLLQAEHPDDWQSRKENIDELISKAADYEQTAEEPSLGEFLEEVALVADIDSMEADESRVLLMTLHSAKGLEFPNVYLAGMEEGLFPGYMTITNQADDPDAMEEERRLCYVGITRAKERLTITHARQRMMRGEVQYNKPSRFLDELPEEAIEHQTMMSGFRQRGGESEAGHSRFGFDSFSSGSGIPASANQRAYAKSKQLMQQPVAYRLEKYGQAEKVASLEYEVGDSVKHIKFGIGIVQQIEDKAKDYEVTVEFERFGMRKLMAGFAKLKKI